MQDAALKLQSFQRMPFAGVRSIRLFNQTHNPKDCRETAKWQFSASLFFGLYQPVSCAGSLLAALLLVHSVTTGR